MYFIDFETNGLFGPLVEFCVLDQNGEVVAYMDEGNDPVSKWYAESIQRTFEQVLLSHVDQYWCFWHHHQMDWIKKMLSPSVVEEIRGKYVFMMDVAYLLEGIHTIDDATTFYARSKHYGHAHSDAMDLFNTYCKLSEVNRKNMFEVVKSMRSPHPHVTPDDQIAAQFDQLYSSIKSIRDASSKGSKEKQYYRLLGMLCDEFGRVMYGLEPKKNG